MTLWLSAALGGLLSAVFFLAVARAVRAQENSLIAAGLVLAQLVYVAFAWSGGAALLSELGLAVVFAAAAWLGLGRPVLLAAAWVAHGLWDARHLALDSAPEWYAVGCLAFDLIVGAYVYARYREQRLKAT